MTSRKRSYGSNPDLELTLEARRPIGELVVPSASPQSSCVSVELDVEEPDLCNLGKHSDGKSMVLVGCQRCLMYVMISDDRLWCPKCESNAVLLIDNLKDHAVKGTSRTRTSRDE